MNTGTARLLLADYGLWWQVERDLLAHGQIVYRGTIIDLAQRHVDKVDGGSAHMVLRIRTANETSYFRKDGQWRSNYTAPIWLGGFYRVHPVTREITVYERPAPQTLRHN
ncbi:hypothetical protein IU485_27740 [Nocardia cyriacigeorgica]|uniref:hypothetical protein n=1 Tax=Nocardia cyriacigeorgica TaxID=135487 RepID=UPI0018958CF2|nr:hypothetical protein [Nocardia cyriacigeorgica]MBF6085170.1 hypothetical protein [Nocardia cyriacigeorgica]